MSKKELYNTVRTIIKMVVIDLIEKIQIEHTKFWKYVLNQYYDPNAIRMLDFLTFFSIMGFWIILNPSNEVPLETGLLIFILSIGLLLTILHSNIKAYKKWKNNDR